MVALTKTRDAAPARIHARASWRAWVRLPDEAGAHIERMAARRGVLPGVYIRMVVLDFLEHTSDGDRSLLAQRLEEAPAPPAEHVRQWTWRVWVRLPDEAGTQLMRLAARRGVLPGVYIRMVVLDYLERAAGAGNTLF